VCDDQDPLWLTIVTVYSTQDQAWLHRRPDCVPNPSCAEITTHAITTTLEFNLIATHLNIAIQNTTVTNIMMSEERLRVGAAVVKVVL